MTNDELWGNIQKGFAKVHDEFDRQGRQIKELDAKADEATKDRQRLSDQIEGVDAHVRGLSKVLVDMGELTPVEAEAAREHVGAGV